MTINTQIKFLSKNFSIEHIFFTQVEEQNTKDTIIYTSVMADLCQDLNRHFFQSPIEALSSRKCSINANLSYIS